MTAPTRPLPRAGLAQEPRARGMWGHLVTMVVLGAVLLWAVARVALHTARGMRWDQRLMDALGGSEQSWARLTDVLASITIGAVVLLAAVCVGVAVLRRRWAVAVGAGVLVAGANLTTQVLKHDVLHRLPGTGPNSLPSGHTTVSLSLVLAALLVASVRARRVAVPVGGFVATFIAAGTIAGHWHRPADVIAGQAVCLIWAGIALATVRLLQRRRARAVRGPRDHGTRALVGSSLVGLAFVAIGVRPTDGDVHLSLAVLALVPVGVLSAVVIWWVAAVADRHVA